MRIKVPYKIIFKYIKENGELIEYLISENLLNY